MLRWVAMAVVVLCVGCTTDAPVTESTDHNLPLDGQVTLNGETIRYAVPEGTCKLDPERPMERFFYDTLSQVVEGDGELFALFVKCDELDLLRTDLNGFEQFKYFGGYFYPLDDDGNPAQVSMPRRTFAKMMTGMAAADAIESGDKVAEKVGEVLADPSAAMTVQEFKSTGHTDDAAYFYFRSRNTTYETEFPVLGALSVTLVHEQIIGLTVVRLTDDPADIDAANEDIRSITTDFLAANPDSDN